MGEVPAELPSAIEVAAAIKAGDYTAMDVLERCITAIEDGNDELNAFVVTDFDHARTLAAGVDEAIAHIACHGSQHTDAIVTENHTRAMRFIREVDSASVMINASTRFADGFEYGLGAEFGISTDKIHARGPVGLDGLTSQKWVVLGDGQVRT